MDTNLEFINADGARVDILLKIVFQHISFPYGYQSKFSVHTGKGFSPNKEIWPWVGNFFRLIVINVNQCKFSVRSVQSGDGFVTFLD